MRNLNGFKLGAALFLLSSTVNADIVIDNKTIPSADITSIIISPNTGEMFVTTNVRYDVAPTGGVTPPPAGLAILSFDATPSTFVAGLSTRLSWTTQNAVSCAATGTGPADWSWASPSASGAGTSDPIVINTAGTYAFTLICKDISEATVSRNETVVVSAAPDPASTSCAASPLGGELEIWDNFWGVAFPQPGYANINDYIPRRGYVAYKFNTGNIVDSGLMVTVGTTLTSGTRKGAISTCPGDFKVSNACSHVWGVGGGITWATDGKSGACHLKADTDYYLNITFTDGTDPNSSTCTSALCIAKLQHVNR